MNALTKLFLILSFFAFFNTGNSILTVKVAQSTGIVIHASANIEIYNIDQTTIYNRTDWGDFNPAKFSEAQKSVTLWLYASEPVLLRQVTNNPNFIRFSIYVSYGLTSFILWGNNTKTYFSTGMTKLMLQLKVLPTNATTFDFITNIDQV
jgi:hypothetical protein